MARLLNLLPWRRRRLERELERELRDHLERRIDHLTQSGVSAADARRQAAMELGGVAQVRERVADTWIWRWLDDLGRDARYALRMLRRSPVFTATAMLSLALGIGANAAIFSLVDRILLRPLAVPAPEQLVYLMWKGTALSTGWGSGYLMSYPLCRDLQEQTEVFDGVFCRHPTSVSVSTGAAHEQVRAEVVTGSYFALLGVRPALGRLLDPSDDVQPGAHPVVVISYAYWRDRLGSAPDVIGRTIRLGTYPMTIVGVAPDSFRGIDPHAVPAVWMPTTMTAQAANIDAYWDRLLDRRAAWLHAVGRMKPGLRPEEAKARLQPWFRSMLDADTRREGFPPATEEQRGRFLASTLDVLSVPRGLSNLRGEMERPLSALMGGTLLLLGLASLNVAGLLLARGAVRRREFTTRLALGASRGRLASQLLVESALVALGGGALGLLAAPAVSTLLLSFLSRDGDVSSAIDTRIFVFAFVVSVVIAAVCGVAPALQAARTPLIAPLKERTRTGSGVRLRKALVAGQMALTLILLVGAGLFVQTLARLHAKGPGFVTDDIAMLRIDPPSSGYSNTESERVMRELLRTLEEVPGVERAAVANTRLLNGLGTSTNMTIERNGRVITDRAVFRMRVGQGFFAMLGAELIAGRDFDQRDIRAPGSPPTGHRTVIVNEGFARRYFPGQSPVGHRVALGSRPNVVTDIEIIGVVKDFNIRTMRDAGPEQAFLQFWDRDSSDGMFYLKLRDRSEAVLASVRDAVARVDPALPVQVTMVDEQIEQSLMTERMLATLSSGFSAIALLLSIVGLYGVMSFIVIQRTQEIGVRLALGATPATAVWLVIRDASMVIGAGTLIGLPGVWALRRLIDAQLFGVSAFDGPTVAVASAALALVALGAAALPAWRAASVSPTEALRWE